MLAGHRDSAVASCSYAPSGAPARRQQPRAPPRRSAAPPAQRHAGLSDAQQRQQRLLAPARMLARASDGDVIDVDADVVDETQLAPKERGELAPNRDGYAVLEMADVEFLLAATADGALDLRDVYVCDQESGVYARPALEGGTEEQLPPAPAHYQAIPWKEEFLGDAVNFREPEEWVRKVFLVRIVSHEPPRLDLDTLWELNAERRAIVRCEVERTCAPSEHEVLRIRDGKFTIVPEEAAPTPDEVIEAAEAGVDAPNRATNEEAVDTEAQELLEAEDDDLDTLDVPAIDLA